MLILSLAFAVFGLVQLVVRLPWPSSWLMRRPLSCPVCLSWWACIFGSLVHGEMLELTGTLDETFLHVTFWSAVAGVAILLEALMSWLKPSAPVLLDPSSFPPPKS